MKNVQNWLRAQYFIIENFWYRSHLNKSIGL